MDELERRQAAMADAKATATIRKNARSIFRSEGDLVIGNHNGTVTMVEFLDYNCGYCMRSYPEVLQLIADNKDLRPGHQGVPSSRTRLRDRGQGSAGVEETGQIRGVPSCADAATKAERTKPS